MSISRYVKKALIISSILLAGNLCAQTEEVTVIETSPSTSYVMPKFKVSLDSTTYDFQGYLPSDSDENGLYYFFENVTYDTQSFSFSYMLEPTLQLSISSLYAKKYAETNFAGTLYNDTTKGVSDVLVKATKTFLVGSNVIVLDGGLSIPTGSITEKNVNDPTGKSNYPYNMQLGSGTYDLLATAMSIKSFGSHQLGVMGHANIKTGRSSVGYRRGNDYNLKSWYSYVYNEYFTPGVWFNYYEQHGIIGEDPTYGRVRFVEYYHRYRNFLDVTLNMNAMYPITKSLKVKAIAGLPVWQDTNNYDNIQVNTRWFASLGVEAVF